MRRMSLLLVLWAGAARAESVADATRHLRGRVATDDKEFPDLPGKKMAQYLEEHIKVRSFKKESGGIWPVYFYAVFKQEAAAGPITVFVYEKGDDEGAVDARSLKNSSKTWTFKGHVELDENLGFNKGRTYEIRVGQLIKNSPRIYARVEVVLE